MSCSHIVYLSVFALFLTGCANAGGEAKVAWAEHLAYPAPLAVDCFFESPACGAP